MQTVFHGEIIGTMILILLGNGVVANVVLKNSKGENAGWMVIASGWAFAVTIAIFVAKQFGSSAAHLNPAVTVAMAIKSGDWSGSFTMILGQMIGAILGATLVWLQYLPHWGLTADPAAKLACFATAPAIRNTTSNMISEIIGTTVLVVAGGCFVSSPDTATALGPFLVGILVWSIGLSLGGPTGYAINPARDLGPRIAHAILPIANKGNNDWSYAWIPVAGPIVGGIIGGMILKML